MSVIASDVVILHKYTYPKKTFLCESADEVQNLPKFGIEGSITNSPDKDINEPVEYGSGAIVKTGEIHFLWPDNTWAPF